MSGAFWWAFEVIQEGGLMVEMNFLQYGVTSYLTTGYGLWTGEKVKLCKFFQKKY